MQNIPRKEVGSGRAPRNGSTDTIIIQDQIRASSLEAPGKDIMRDQRVRTVAPFSRSTSNSPLFDRNDLGIGSGLDPEKLSSQMTGSIKPLSSTKFYHPVDHLPEAKVPDNLTPPIPPSSTSLAQRKYVPSLDSLHPSQFSSPTTSDRRPKELQPARLRAESRRDNQEG